MIFGRPSDFCAPARRSSRDRRCRSSSSPVDELDLELDERAGRAPAVEHVDRVDRDVRERALAVRDPDAAAARPQCRDLLELPVALVREEQRGELGRRAGGAPESLDLGARIARARQLQLPARDAVLEPTPKRDPDASERARRRVVVRRGEHPRLERLSAGQRGSSKRAVELQFQLAFENRLHALDRRAWARSHVDRAARRTSPLPSGPLCALPPGNPLQAHRCKARCGSPPKLRPVPVSEGYEVENVRRRPGRGPFPFGSICPDHSAHEHLRRCRPSRHADEHAARRRVSRPPRRSRGSAVATSHSGASTSCRRSTASSRGSGRSTVSPRPASPC